MLGHSTFADVETSPTTERSHRKPKQKRSDMKTMTCQQLGGPCDLALQGETADEIIKAQDGHLKEAVANGDVNHAAALKDMKGRWKHPISGMRWYKNTNRTFAELPER